jgi:hypothetical protein
MELFRLNREVQRFAVIEGNVVNTYWSYNIIAIEKQHIGIASIIKEMSRNIISVIDPIHYINIAMLRK